MRIATAEKLARFLKWAVIVFFILLLVLLLFVPFLTGIRSALAGSSPINTEFSVGALFSAWKVLLGGNNVWRTVLAWFMLFCGICCAVILWQARIVLKNIAIGKLFVSSNKNAMVRAGISCFLISAAAIVRLVINLIIFPSWAPIVTYTSFFIPLFAFAGLVFLIGAALFAGAADLKEENDLVI